MELQIPPSEYYNGMSIPHTDNEFRQKFGGGLKCCCPSNFLFHSLHKWKNHIKGKKHKYHLEKSSFTNEASTDNDKIIKNLKILNGQLAQENEQLKNKIITLEKKNN